MILHRKNGISPEDVDLTKFVHIRTTLSIPKHHEIVEQELGDFLHKNIRVLQWM